MCFLCYHTEQTHHLNIHFNYLFGMWNSETLQENGDIATYFLQRYLLLKFGNKFYHVFAMINTYQQLNTNSPQTNDKKNHYKITLPVCKFLTTYKKFLANFQWKLQRKWDVAFWRKERKYHVLICDTFITVFATSLCILGYLFSI